MLISSVQEERVTTQNGNLFYTPFSSLFKIQIKNNAHIFMVALNFLVLGLQVSFQRLSEMAPPVDPGQKCQTPCVLFVGCVSVNNFAALYLSSSIGVVHFIEQNHGKFPAK